jgi:hypothetical protein
MSIGPGQPNLAGIRWAHEWQHLSWTAMNQAVGHYLQGCANVAMARTPQQALAAVYEAQAVLLRHSMETFAGATRLCASRAPDHTHKPRNPAAKS